MAAANPTPAAGAASEPAPMKRQGSSAKEHFMLHVQVIEARGVGSSDLAALKTYCVIKVYNHKRKKHTSKVDKSLNPVWNEFFSFPLNQTHYDMHMVVKVWSSRPLGTDQFLGKVSIPLAQFRDVNFIQGWFDLQSLKLDARVNGSVFLRVAKDLNFARLKKKNPELLRRHVRTLMRERSAEVDHQQLDETKTLKIFVGSWNVGNKPPPDDLSPWLPAPGAGFDLVAVGSQECEYKHRKPHRTVQADWEAALQRHFGDGYIMMGAYQLWEMRLVILARRDVVHLVHDVQYSTEATGIANVLGNKGGVAISLNVMDTSLCFVNSHLAAHQHKTKKRNEDVREIIKGVRLGLPDTDVLNQFSHVIWMGDLNYRLNFGEQGDEKSPAPEEFRAMTAQIERGELRGLFELDQLAGEMRAGNVFRRFQEGDVATFAPTFKVVRGEVDKYLEQRSPAWCDRILWRSLPGASPLRQHALGSARHVLTSDHKPVWAHFDLELKRLQPGITESFGPCTLRIKNLKGHGLRVADVTGTSDPFIKFFGSCLRDAGATTATKTFTLDPVWGDKEVPVLRLALNRPERLHVSTITMVVYDFDVGPKNDILGNTVLPLSQFVPYDRARIAEVDGKEQPFELEVEYAGLPSGTLTGSVVVSWEPSTFEAVHLPASEAN